MRAEGGVVVAVRSESPGNATGTHDLPRALKPSRTASNGLSHGCQTEHHLHYGGSQKPIFSVAADAIHPGMWRVVLPDGSLSDMANLTRAKDAAFVMADRGPPRRNQSLLRWRTQRAVARIPKTEIPQ